VIVESGDASRMMAAYIDLNPVRAGMLKDPADYRWRSYGEALGGHVEGDGLTRDLERKGNSKKACEGLVRACMGHKWVGFDSVKWKEAAKLYRKMLGCWIRYFTSGAVIGSRMFVNEVFTSARERFSSRRKDGARP
jgi:putative transposase